MWNDPKKYSQAWNFGPMKSNQVVSVSKLVSKIISNWGTGNWKNISDSTSQHEANLLMLDSTKANQHLKWNPVFSVDETISETIKWYVKYFESNQNMEDFTLNQIYEYIRKGKKGNLYWAK